MTRLDELRAEVQHCTACELYKEGTQAVFGEGLAKAEVMFVGEQPGDREDREGRPFVGPAGRMLDRALEEAGIDRGAVYLTNVGKHFKFEPRGKRRIPQAPNARERAACRPWFDAELERVKPEVLVCLGAIAAKALLGNDFRITRERGRFVESGLAPRVIATPHPSTILRARDDEERRLAYETLVNDLELVAKAISDGSPARR